MFFTGFLGVKQNNMSRTKEENTIYMRKWRAKNKEKNKKYKKDFARKWRSNPKNKEQERKKHREWKQKTNYIQKNRTLNAIRHKAWRNIPIPKGKKCEECNKRLARERHHPNYSKPLKVILCCKKCHIKLDETRRQKTK